MKVWNTGSGGGRRADEGSKADLDKGGGGCDEVDVIGREVGVIVRKGRGRRETH